jgi:putative transcriptional regulator
VKKPKAIRIPAVDVAELRASLGLSVSEFAERYGFTPGSIRNWEAGTHEPFRMAKILLAIVAAHPEMVDDVLKLPKEARAFRAFPDA